MGKWLVGGPRGGEAVEGEAAGVRLRLAVGQSLPSARLVANESWAAGAIKAVSRQCKDRS